MHRAAPIDMAKKVILGVGHSSAHAAFVTLYSREGEDGLSGRTLMSRHRHFSMLRLGSSGGRWPVGEHSDGR